ncbi:hypothetical protein EUGRSUZ_F01516 [Eucalyptus grandis]|uniref:Uncharacterized protein n=2 Tax=Eucalyptus grandis TaxID=71139 RepID=A0ACC3KF58_EUCGR|nr:hypothetical protein EUGRSUZ_F01516 [Eucalyptus grandis]
MHNNRRTMSLKDEDMREGLFLGREWTLASGSGLDSDLLWHVHLAKKEPSQIIHQPNNDLRRNENWVLH